MANDSSFFDDLILYVLAVFFPPLPVIIRRGWGWDLTLNLLFCLLAWVPGVLHAWLVLARHPANEKRRRHSVGSHGSHHGSHHEGYRGSRPGSYHGSRPGSHHGSHHDLPSHGHQHAALEYQRPPAPHSYHSFDASPPQMQPQHMPVAPQPPLVTQPAQGAAADYYRPDPAYHPPYR